MADQEMKADRQVAHEKPPEDNPPNPTLYIRNLNEKVGKEELRKSLWQMFHQFGEIIDIYCRPKVLATKGQAWICFRDVAAAATAKDVMQGYSFYSQKIVISFARAKSDAIAKLEGSYVERRPKKAKKRKGEKEDGQKKRKKKTDGAEAQGGAEPNNTLFVENCPEDASDLDRLLQCCFRHFPGFVEVRLPGVKGAAFVEFTDEGSASQALHGLQNFELTEGRQLKLSYAKR